ncbi:MAG TPA: tripartite tricarboxylate transporter substrate binding protein [Xanthobacteraceae bacterium]|nr:tripartite tricarboxylate transporter substrate binding protein [Xanthobacteraceae bacterium]
MGLSRRSFLKCSAALLSAGARGARAQTFPERPIRLVVPFPPGGVFDFIGRPLADRLKTTLGAMYIENVGGGGGTLGGAAVAHGRADGYTFLLGGTTQYVTEALLKRQPLYDPLKELDPVANAATTTFAITVHPSVPAQNLEAFVAYAKANPGKLSYGSSGAGTLNHLTGEALKLAAGLPDLTHVPYRGAGPAISDLMGGQILVNIPAMSGQVLAFHRADKLRILAVVSPQRLPGTPELPTAVEQGFPTVVATQLIGLIAPAGTPPEIIAKVAPAVRTAVADKGFTQTLRDAGVEPDPDSTPETFRAALVADLAHWKPVTDAMGLKID